MATPPAVSAPWRPRVIRELTVATDMPSVGGGAGGSIASGAGDSRTPRGRRGVGAASSRADSVASGGAASDAIGALKRAFSAASMAQARTCGDLP